MPQILKIGSDEGGIVAVWEIDENSEQLLEFLELSDDELERVNAYRLERRKQEFLAVRCLLKQILGIDPDINYLPSGRPVLVNSKYKVSISHTKGYVAVALSKGNYVGVDIEYPSERVSRVCERFISSNESEFIPVDMSLQYYTLIWCLKETLYKMIDKENIVFNHHFICHSFVISDSGRVKATYKESECEEFDFDYLITDNYYLVYHC